MTRPFLVSSIAACLTAFSAPPLVAQTFTANAAAQYGATRLFTLDAGHSIGAFDVSPGGDVFYLDVPSTGTGSTKLFVRTAASEYAAPTFPIFDYGSALFGSFVRVHDGVVYFGESSAFSIRSFTLATSTVSFIGTVPGHYDVAFRGTEAFVSANAGSSPQNKVSKLNLSNAQLDPVLRTSDFSGPIAFDTSGGLLYGAGVFGGETGGIFQFTAAQVNGAINPTGPDTSLTLSDGARRFNNGSNQYLALADNAHLFQGDSPFGAPAVAKRFDLTTASSEEVGRTASGEYFSGLATQNSALFVGVSSANTSAVFRVAVPEPAAGTLALAGLVGLASRPRRLR